jgi:hypothetical protein
MEKVLQQEAQQVKKKGREPVRIDGMTRVVHHVAARIIEGKEVVGFFNEEEQVYQHDIKFHNDQKFWRGAYIG